MPILAAINNIEVALVLLAGGVPIATVCAIAFSSMARQPEAAAKLSTSMIVGAAMLEGATLFALVICLIK